MCILVLFLAIAATSIASGLPCAAVSSLSQQEEPIGQVLKISGPVFFKKNAKAKEIQLHPVQDRTRSFFDGEMVRCGEGGGLRLMLNRKEVEIKMADGWVTLSREPKQDQSEKTGGAGRRAGVEPNEAAPPAVVVERTASEGTRSDVDMMRREEMMRKEKRRAGGMSRVSGSISGGSGGFSQSRSMVNEILEHYLRAIDGKDAFRRTESGIAEGTVELPARGLKGSVEIHTEAPDKAAAIMTFPGFGTVQEGYNGDVGWVQEPGTGVREKAVSELLAAKSGLELFRSSRLMQLYPDLDYIGTTTVNDRTAYLLKATPSKGGSEALYFDSRTGLLVRVDSTVETDRGKVFSESYLEDYKEVGGVKIPFTIRSMSGKDSVVIRLKSVKQNVPVDDVKFIKPKGQ